MVFMPTCFNRKQIQFRYNFSIRSQWLVKKILEYLEDSFATLYEPHMASLVADYSSDTDSSYDSDSSEVQPKSKSAELSKPTLGLPKPDFKVNSTDGSSVFVNPFVEADNAKIAILERHVKMISTDVKTVNGKKICWNYRKNKCRFGHNCKYAHDSDVQTDVKKVTETNENVNIRNLVLVENKKSGNICRTKRKGANTINPLLPLEKIMKTSTNNNP